MAPMQPVSSSIWCRPSRTSAKPEYEWSEGERSIGVLEDWSDDMQTSYKNKNRGYQQLIVWQEAIAKYVQTCRVFRAFPYELKRVASQQIATVDSVHRNIAEGYGRR